MCAQFERPKKDLPDQSRVSSGPPKSQPQETSCAHLRRQRGQGAVELALALPVLILILMGVIDLGRVFYTYVTITNASRVGAEFAMDPRRNQAEVREIIKGEARPHLTLADSDITFVTPGWAAGNVLTVEVRTRFSAATPLIESFWGGGQLTMRALTTTRFNAT